MAATEPAMIRVMKGIAFHAMAMIDAERPVVADELRQLQPERPEDARKLAAAVEQDHDDEGGDDRGHDQRRLVERREEPLAGKARLQRHRERNGDERG